MPEPKSGKPAATRKRTTKKAAPTAATTANAGTLEVALAALGRRADEARVKLATMTDDGAKAAGKSLDKASKATKSKVRDLNRKWQKLEPKHKAQWIAGVLGAIAAAAAIPLVVRERRKKKTKK